MRTACVLFAVALTSPLRADEGMWTFQNFPSDLVEQKYGVRITEDWLDRVQESTVRLANCTGSFVSSSGLILTNHHCAASCLAEHSTREKSLLEQGFLARSPQGELRCAAQVADVLVSTEDITQAVSSATAGLDSEAANTARKQTLTRLEQDCEQTSRTTGRREPLKCESVRLYEGGQYFLYKYRRYPDVRLVFAPEEDIAAFGGDPDNFQFPRWSLDMALMRAYAGNGPARIPNPLRIDFRGPEAGQLVFVSGNPGSTDRLLTLSELLTLRDVELPRWLLRAAELRGRFIQFSKAGAEAARIVQEPLAGLENSIKVRRKLLDALHDQALLDRKREAERALREKIAANPELARRVGDAWEQIAAAQQEARAISLPHTFIEQGAGFNSNLFRYARELVRAAQERSKPNAERLREYTDAALPRLEQQIRADVPVYPDVEQITLSFSLERMRELLGPDHPIVRMLLKDDSPDTLAARLIMGSRLGDVAYRAKLWEGGIDAIEASGDPMIQLALKTDPQARELRQRYENKVEAPMRSASERLSEARFALLGTSVYPDATFTLRLNYGTVQGWSENGVQVDPFTRLAGLYERATGREPFRVPQVWQNARAGLDPNTRFNLATTNDIVGGNSGSPLIDARGRVVGLIFDGNIHSISGAFWFDVERNRAIAVHPAIMRAALDEVYEANELLTELEQSTPGTH